MHWKKTLSVISLIGLLFTMLPPYAWAQDGQIDPVTATPVSGVVASGTKVKLSTAATGAAITYTTDGSDPKTSGSSKIYTAPLSIGSNTTVKAYSTVAGNTYSEVSTFDYTILSIPNWTYEIKPQADATIGFDNTVSHSGRSSLKITNATPPMANVYARVWQNVTVKPNTTYTFSAWVKGTNVKADISVTSSWSPRYPIPSGDWQNMTFQYTTAANETALSFRVVVPDVTTALWVDDVTMTEYGSAANLITNGGFETQLLPVKANVASGSVTAGTTVALSTASSGTTIYYTTDGSDPRSSVTSKTYTGPVVIDRDMTLQAYAGLGSLSSDLAVFNYTVKPLVIDQSSLGNIFFEPEQPLFTIRAASDRLTWQVKDWWGNTVEDGQAVPGGPVYNLNLAMSQKGYFTLNVTAWQGTAVLEEASTPFAVLTSFDLGAMGDSRFGIAGHFSKFWDSNLIPLIAKSGIQAVREEHDWKKIELQKGVYTFPSRNETYMAKLKQEGVDPFIILDYVNPLYDHGYTPYTQEGYTGFANYGEQVLNHYGTQMKWVEIYNEYNNSNFGDIGSGPADCLPQYYLELLKASYQKIKLTHPDVTVVGPVVVGIPWTWLETFFQLGGLQYLDAVSVHPYIYPDAPEKLKADLIRLDNLVKQYNNGQSKPIWISEIGWPTLSSFEGISEDTQAQYLVRSHVAALSAGVQKVFWYSLMNDGIDANERENNFGLIRYLTDSKGAYTPKPGYVSYAAMIRQLSGAAYVSQDQTDANVYSYLFQKDQVSTRVMWALNPTNVAFQTDSPLVITDAMGNSETYTPYNGKIYLTLNGSPVYVKGNVNGVSVDGTFTVHADNALIDSTIPVEVVLDNTGSVSALTADIEVEGGGFKLTANAGTTAQYTAAVPGVAKTGTKTIFTRIHINGAVAGKLSSSVQIMQSSVTAAPVKHVVDGSGADVLRISLNNTFASDNQLTSVNWQFDSQTGTQSYNATVPGGGKLDVDLPIPSLPAGQSVPVSLQMNFAKGAPVPYQGKAVLFSPDAIAPLAQKTIVVDGQTDDFDGIGGIDLSGDGTVVMLGTNVYNGADDLSGKVWITWDNDNLYLSAHIHDQVFSQKDSGGSIWKGDSIQFGIASGLPGETTGRYEYGLTLTPAGPELYRFSVPQGTGMGTVAGASVQVVRDEAGRNTIYEAAIPWSSLQPIVPADRVFSLSLLVNDDDGQGRKGWIEWGSGIGGKKDTSKYKPVRLVSPVLAAVSPEQPDGLNGWYVHPVTVSVYSADMASVTASVYSLDSGVTWNNYAGPVTFGRDGIYNFDYKSTDYAGRPGQTKRISFNLDVNAPSIIVSEPAGGSISDAGDLLPQFTASDGGSGVDHSKTVLTLDGQTILQGAAIPLYILPLGTHTLTIVSSDLAGNTGSVSVQFQTTASIEGIKTLIAKFSQIGWIDNDGITNSLNEKMDYGDLSGFINEVQAQRGNHINNDAADYLLRDAKALQYNYKKVD